MTEQAAALVAAEAFVLVVEPQQMPEVLVAAGKQGPTGPPGTAADLPTDPLAYYILARS